MLIVQSTMVNLKVEILERSILKRSSFPLASLTIIAFSWMFHRPLPGCVQT